MLKNFIGLNLELQSGLFLIKLVCANVNSSTPDQHREQTAIKSLLECVLLSASIGMQCG